MQTAKAEDFWSDLDEGVRLARNIFERAVPRQYQVGHDGHKLVVMRDDHQLGIDVYGFLLAKDRRDICGLVIKRLGTAKRPRNPHEQEH